MRSLSLETWRDCDPHSFLAVPEGVEIPQEALLDPGIVARDLYASGIRRVRLVEPLRNEQPLRFLHGVKLIAEFTARGVVVDWDLLWQASDQMLAQLVHLPPPTEADLAAGSRDVFDFWRDRWQLLLLVERWGPGFVQVNDKRRAPTVRIIFDEPEELELIRELQRPLPFRWSAGLMEALTELGLVLSLGEFCLWLPVRFHRWPLVARAAVG